MSPYSLNLRIGSTVESIERTVAEIRKYGLEHAATLHVICGNLSQLSQELSHLAGIKKQQEDEHGRKSGREDGEW